MDARKILNFLRDIKSNNNRLWFAQHRLEYLDAKEEFEQGVSQVIQAITFFDLSVAHITTKDAIYRFYRDTRFSPDKSPYKRHFGAYIAAHGKKAFHGGYYLHIEPRNCFLACGSYWLPTNILTACRNEIIINKNEWIKRIKNRDFIKYFGKGDQSSWESDFGFGIERLKTRPVGFPNDSECIEYLRMKDYCCWHRINEDFFDSDDWIARTMPIFKAAKPMLDFVNAVIDDYE